RRFPARSVDPLRRARGAPEPRTGARRRLRRQRAAPTPRRVPRRARVNGYVAAAAAVLIWAAYPVATRAGVTGTFSPQDLVTLRFGVGALLFLPYLLLNFRAIQPKAWLQG